MPALDYHYRTLYFLKYNNYANRIMKREDTLEGYLDASYNHTYIQIISDCKLWNPNDGITTVITTPLNTDFDIEPDYLLVVNDDAGISTINSRWFITETVRLRQGQYQCFLKRDVFAEAWDELMNASCNIHRAIISRYDTLIFNKEPIAVNQILDKETLIKDKTGCPWIVFYGDSAFGPEDIFSVTPNIQYDYAVNNLSEITGNADPLSTYGTNYFLYPNSFSISLVYKNDNNTTIAAPAYPYYYRTGHTDDVPLTISGAEPVETSPKPRTIGADFTGYDYEKVWEAARDWLDIQSYQTLTVLDDLYQNQKVIYDRNTMRYYKITSMSTTLPQPTPTPILLSSAPDSFKTAFNNAFSLDYLIPKDSHGDPISVSWPWIFMNSFVLNYAPSAWTFALTQVDVPGAVNVSIPNGYLPNDNPYSIWCMPYGDIQVKFNGVTYTTSKELNKNVATAISRKFSRNKIWDVQILPYCPIPDEFFNADGIIETNDSLLTTTSCIRLAAAPYTVKGFIFCVPQSSFETQIMLDTPVTINDPKLSDTCDTWRLCSPNYGSLFEFSAAKNEGIYGFNIRCTYMPIQPYIRIAPIWGGLYGDEMFKYDTRGLILGGDFSIARIDDKWVQYQENNKNYAAIFDRQLNNMDVLRDIQREQERWGVAAGVVQGAASGAIAGSMVGGGYGAVAGAVVGGVGAGITGARDLELNEKAFQENRDYATDVYNLNLMNVQAMPRSIAKTTAFNVDNRYFPILAHYTCSLSERQMVEKFIQNHSMLLDAIGTPSSYVNNSWVSQYGIQDRGFIQGSIIKIDTIHDTHFVDALNEEFRKGVFTK